MWIRNIENRREFRAGDDSRLREILHPAKDGLEIRYSLAHAVVEPGQKTRAHSLASAEVYYLLQGNGVMHIDGEEATVGPGQTVYIPPRSVQYIENTGREVLRFLCIVDPAWRSEDEKVF